MDESFPGKIKTGVPGPLTDRTGTMPFWGGALVVTGFFCIVFGIKLAMAVRFGTSLPIADEWKYVDFLSQWQQGQHNWGALLMRHGQHFIVMTKLMAIWITSLNGLIEPRLQTVVFGLVYSIYATVTAWVLGKVLKGTARPPMLLAALLVFAIPFAGFRSTWSFLDEFTFAMLFSVLAIYLVVFRPLKAFSDVIAVFLIVAAASSVGSGCLLGFAIGGYIGVRGLLERRLAVYEGVLGVFGMGVFLAVFLTMPHGEGGGGFSLVPALKTLLSSMAWPTVFLPVAGVLAFLPVGILTTQFLRGHYNGNRSAECLVMFGGFVALQCAGIGLFRGDAGNFNMPSNRYNDILILAPLANFCALLFLLEDFSRSRLFRMVAFAWLCLTAGGFGVHLLWRTWPFLAHENGESYHATMQYSARRYVETGDKKWIPDLFAKGWTEEADISDSPDRVRAFLSGAYPQSLLTPGAMVGVPLEVDATNSPGFVRDGYPFSYFAFPGLAYWGSFTAEREEGVGTFVSKPFEARASYLIMDVIVHKKARFSSYRMDGLSLKLVETGTGREIPLLGQLRKDFPSLFRDRETVWASTTKGRYYQLVAEDQSPADWLAFSQPREGGNLTPVTQTLLSSGKILVFFGVMSLLAGFYLPRARKVE